ncbi:MAG TPA: radical SAM protein [Candidatus Omnitrophota bacterium]|nr:radical SAM protein [Candidatus Omnitrophota bacterium]
MASCANKKVCLAKSADCARREIELASYGEFFRQNSWEITKDPNAADLILLSTCAYCKGTEDASVREIKKLGRLKKKDTPLVVCGCLPKINKKRLDSVFMGASFGPGESALLDQIIHARVKTSRIRSPNGLASPLTPSESETFLQSKKSVGNFISAFQKARREKTRDFFLNRLDKKNDLLLAEISRKNRSVFKIQIAQGCLSDCSYCAIKFAAGKLRSRPPEEILKDLNAGLDAGHRDFELIAEDAGCYGDDIGMTLASLLREFFKRAEDYKLCINDIGAASFLDHDAELRPLFYENRSRIDHITVPIQSGSDRILRRMNRGRYPLSEIKAGLNSLQRGIPSLRIATHLMVGFPGETEEDFQATLDLVRETAFDPVYLYKYTDRPGTLSSGMSRKVPEKVKLKRLFNPEVRNLFGTFWNQETDAIVFFGRVPALALETT